MSETTTSEFYQPYFPHTQKQDEVLNRSQYYHPVAVPDSEYYWWTPDPTLYSVAECATTSDLLGTRSIPAAQWCEDYRSEDSCPAAGYSGRPNDYSTCTSSPCLERLCDVFRSHTSTTNYQGSETASSGQPQRPFQCNHCQKNFPKKADRDRHEFSVHREKMRTPRGLIDCPEKGCPRRDMKGFTRKDNLLDHRRRVHNRNIPKRNHALGGRSVRR